jgi:hypothetical protein
MSTSRCPICNNLFNDNHIMHHASTCNTYNTYDVPPFTDNQQLALKFCKKKSKIHAKNTKQNVLMRFIELGYTESDMINVINHIKYNVQTIIHIRAQTILDHMLDDDHVKNCYEVAKGLGRHNGYVSGRTDWENNLFNMTYTKSEPIEKVKYGALNMFCSNNGLSCCTGYGESFFILKDELKTRTSFVNGDSSLKMFHLCTYKYPTSLLLHLSDQYLTSLIDYVNGNHSAVCSKNFNYVEAQIHGDIRLNKDIDKFVLMQSVLKLTDDKLDGIIYFCNKNNIQLEIK